MKIVSNFELSRREFLGVAALVTGAGPENRSIAPSSVADAADVTADQWFSNVPVGRSVVRSGRAMVATSQPLASQTGIDILKRD